MKLKLALLAAAMIAAPFSIAMADEHAAPAAEVAADAAVAATAPAVAAYEVTLQSGAKVSVEGDHAFVVGADGAKTAAPDGDHVLADGTTMTVAGGVITAGKPAAPAPAVETAPMDAHAPAEGAAH
jgi:hypothetical protein